MATIHISEAEAARDLAAVLAQVEAGADVVIDRATHAVKLSIADPPKGQSLSKLLALAEERVAERGYAPVMDEAFAADMREIIANRKPRKVYEWD